MSSDRQIKKLSDIALVNPKESIPQGEIAKKVPMEKLRPFSRDVNEFVLEKFSGGAKFKNGDTIMARITPCLENGKTAKINFLDNDEVGFGSTEYIVFRAIEGQCDEDYLYYLIISPIVRESAIKSMVGSSGRQRVQTDVIQNLKILVPSFNDQQTIGRIFRSIDDKIAVNDKINQNLEQQAQTMIEKYCSEVESTSQLSSIMNFENGYAFSSKTYLSEGKYHIITIKNVKDGKIDSEGAACVNELPKQMREGCQLQIGDVLLSLTGNVGRVGIVCEENLLLNQRVAKVVPYNNSILPFLYFFLRQPVMKSQMEMIAKGTAQLNLSPIETLQLSIPYEDALVLELAGTLFPLYSTIIYNTEECIKLGKLRDVLLPRLMSGELDVSKLDVQADKS